MKLPNKNIKKETRSIFFFESEIKGFYFLPKWNFIEYYLHNDMNFFFMTPNNFFINQVLTSKNISISHLNFFNQNNVNLNNVNSLLNINKNDQIFSSLNEVQFQNFVYFKKSNFITFFINNLIDVPICFKKSFSLKRKNFELPLLKFLNLLMKEGKREKIIKNFFFTFRIPKENQNKEIKQEIKIKKSEYWKNFENIENFEKYNLFSTKNNWLTWYFYINNCFFNKINNNFFFFNFEYQQKDIDPNRFFLIDHKLINTSNFFKNNLIETLTKINPIFSYFIYNVDKNIKKFSRGKAGKYLFIWKYVASYKRIHLAMRWIAKEIKFNQEKNISKRISETFFNLKSDINNTFAWKSKIFSHNYVFKNFRHTLMRSLKTIK